MRIQKVCTCQFLLHPKDTKLCVSGLDFIPASHGGSQAETEVLAGVLGRDDAVVL